MGKFDSAETFTQVSSNSDHDGGTHIFDLPHALLCSILARISDPVTATFTLCSCRLFRALSKSVPYTLRLSSMAKLEDGTLAEEQAHNKFSLTASVGTITRKVLCTVRRQMPATMVLDLSGCWIVDEDVAAVLADLRSLKCLILDGCQKLTSAVADALAVSVRSGPQSLSLQRCFGLGPAAAGNLLAAAAADGSQLQCVLLSHLDRLDLPRDPPLLEAQETDIDTPIGDESAGAKLGNVSDIPRGGAWNAVGIGFGIRILALHNCASLGAHELAALGMTCPVLEFLMLGGSMEALCLSGPEGSPPELSSNAISVLARTVESLRFLRVLEATFFPVHVVQGVREHVGKMVEVWNFCERKSVFCAASYWTSMGVPLSHCSLYSKVSNFSLSDTLKFYKQEVSAIWYGNTEAAPAHEASKLKNKINSCGRNDEWKQKVLLALRAAVNCSDLRRRAPLHLAANDGDTEMIRGLLSLGASPGLRNSAGETALFTAAWFGHADICHLLLLGGADVLTRNRSGENPLYIAALRGHSQAVEVMLSHCNSNDINWQSAEVYGDGWTPLMAAAVADRQDVAKVLLKAAGLGFCLDCPTCNTLTSCIVQGSNCSATVDEKQVVKFDARNCFRNLKGDYDKVARDKMWSSIPKAQPQILDAQNRYGQTALHIAARRASLWFVVVLLHAGASIDIRDEYDKRPVDIAHKHVHITDLLKQWEKHANNILDVSLLSSEQSSASASGCTLTGKSLTKSKGAIKDGAKNGPPKRVWRAKVKPTLADNPTLPDNA